MEIVFWISSFCAVYSYAIYPIVLSLLPRRRPGAPPDGAADQPQPLVSLVIACRNERARIAHKLENSLELLYPRIEIIVASDASDDGSHAIVKSYEARGVRLVASPDRRGKEHAQGLAIRAARGEVVVFSDAGTDLPPDSIDRIVADFRDPRVGAVSSEDTFLSTDGTVVGEGLYVRYEMWLRRLESSRWGLVGLSGSFFAVRREVLDRWDTSIPSDFASAINTVRAGLVAVSNPGVRGIYRDIKDPAGEYRRKVRTAMRGMAALAAIPEVLNPGRYGVFAFQVWSHKVMRWLVPWFLLVAFVVNGALVERGGPYPALFVLQVLGYGLAAGAHVLPALRRVSLVRIVYYFVVANLALGHAGIRFLMGQRITFWEPSVR
jgi:glycosyltransferase involved in cell wall biosynthesis